MLIMYLQWTSDWNGMIKSNLDSLRDEILPLEKWINKSHFDKLSAVWSTFIN